MTLEHAIGIELRLMTGNVLSRQFGISTVDILATLFLEPNTAFLSLQLRAPPARYVLCEYIIDILRGSSKKLTFRKAITT